MIGAQNVEKILSLKAAASSVDVGGVDVNK
jgi:hypothetical protein